MKLASVCAALIFVFACGPGSSGGDAPPGTTGSGTAGATQPGTGLQGGLGAANGSMAPGQPTAATEGSRNRTTGGSVGNR